MIKSKFSDTVLTSKIPMNVEKKINFFSGN